MTEVGGMSDSRTPASAPCDAPSGTLAVTGAPRGADWASPEAAARSMAEDVRAIPAARESMHVGVPPLLATEQRRRRASEESELGAMPDKAALRVLIVEDDDSVRALVSSVLSTEGYEVRSAADGAMARELLATWAPGVILLDLHVPGPSSDALARACREASGPRPAIIVFTAAGDAAAADHVARIGADGFLAKPFDLDALIQIVGQYAATPPAQLAAGDAVTDKQSAADPAYRRCLRLLREELTTVQATIARVRGETTRLGQIEAVRRLTKGEAARVRTLRLESEALYLQLQALRREFETLREQRPRGAPAGPSARAARDLPSSPRPRTGVLEGAQRERSGIRNHGRNHAYAEHARGNSGAPQQRTSLAD